MKSGRWFQITDYGNLPIRISLVTFLLGVVVVQRHKEWTTSGEFHVRFLRRFSVLDKRCTARIEVGPFEGSAPSPSDSGLSSTEESDLYTALVISIKEEGGQQIAAYRAWGVRIPTPTPTSSYTLIKVSIPIHCLRMLTLFRSPALTGSSESGQGSTGVENHHGSGAAALKGTGGGIIPPGLFAFRK